MLKPIKTKIQQISGLFSQPEYQQLVETYDYASCIDGPPSIIDAQGNYIPGWFSEFGGTFNFEDASGPEKRFQKWIHIHFETKDYFIVANIAHMGMGGNVAILLHHKKSGKTDKASATRYLVTNRISSDSQFMQFEDGESGSWIHLHANGAIEFDVKTGSLAFEGRAQTTMGKPFVQSTVYSPGMGTLQWWGNLKLDSGSITHNGQTTPLEPGSFGAYDRTIGHRPQEQNWNWVSAVGEAQSEDDPEQTLTFSLQVSKEKERARPRIHSQKYNLWLGDVHTKYDDLTIDYTSDPHTKETGKWRILAVGQNDSLNLTFHPQFHRREEKWLPGLLDIDFNQYYGLLSGRLVSAGQSYRIHRIFTVCEDSRMHIKI